MTTGVLALKTHPYSEIWRYCRALLPESSRLGGPCPSCLNAKELECTGGCDPAEEKDVRSSKRPGGVLPMSPPGPQGLFSGGPGSKESETDLYTSCDLQTVLILKRLTFLDFSLLTCENAESSKAPSNPKDLTLKNLFVTCFLLRIT